MRMSRRAVSAVVGLALLGASAGTAGQTRGEPERFTAVAIVNDNVATGVERVEISVSRWSTDSERTRLVTTLMEKGPRALLDALQHMPSAGRIRTPDSLGYDLRFAQQTPLPEGGRRIVLGTDRPIGFWEATNRPRSIDYPFTVVQMEIDPDGHGTGTLSLYTKVLAHDDIIELENFTSQPVMLTQIASNRARR